MYNITGVNAENESKYVRVVISGSLRNLPKEDISVITLSVMKRYSKTFNQFLTIQSL